MKSPESRPHDHHIRQAAIAVMLTLAGLGIAPACDITPIVGALLEGIASGINQVVDNATGDLQAATLSAAGAADTALGGLESSLSADMSKHIDEVDTVLQQQEANLQNTVLPELEKGTAAALNSATHDAEQIILSTPFANKNPQVTSYSPHFVAAGSDVPIHVVGVFAWAMLKNLKPQIRVNGSTYDAQGIQTQDLNFVIPGSVFTSSSSTKLSFVSLELDIPFEKGFVYHTIEPGVFRLLISVLPQSPVSSLLVDNQVAGISTHLVQQPGNHPWVLDSSDCVPHKQSNTFGPPDQWSISPAQSIVVVGEFGGWYSLNFSVVSAQQIVQEAATAPNCLVVVNLGNSGYMNWSIKYWIQQPTDTTKETSYGLGWGDSLVLPVTPRQWTVKAVLFNGEQKAFGGSDSRNPYLQVQDLGNKVEIDSPSPESIGIPWGIQPTFQAVKQGVQIGSPTQPSQ